jgi:hypothetical protein
MAENEKLVLGDKSIYPSDEILFSIIGDKKIVWQKILSYAKDNYKDVTWEWRFYNDGKQWLFKMQQKKKTLFWIGVLKDTFRITFYFGKKAEPLIEGSQLPQKIKDGFREAKSYGLIRPITTVITGISDLENIQKLIDIKVKLK